MQGLAQKARVRVVHIGQFFSRTEMNDVDRLIARPCIKLRDAVVHIDQLFYRIEMDDVDR